jgi:hypothetical protein
MATHLSRPAMCLTGLLLLTAATTARDIRQAPAPPVVTIDGLTFTYGSCGIVRFSVRNMSSHSVYVHVYVENREAGAWTHVPCQYDLNDPRSRTAKLALSERNMIRAGGSMAIAYDRCTDYAYCMRPKYGTYDPPLAGAMLQAEDARMKWPVTQRIRVDAYWREAARPVAVVFSEPLRRVPPR